MHQLDQRSWFILAVLRYIQIWQVPTIRWSWRGCLYGLTRLQYGMGESKKRTPEPRAEKRGEGWHQREKSRSKRLSVPNKHGSRWQRRTSLHPAMALEAPEYNGFQQCINLISVHDFGCFTIHTNLTSSYETMKLKGLPIWFNQVAIWHRREQKENTWT